MPRQKARDKAAKLFRSFVGDGGADDRAIVLNPAQPSYLSAMTGEDIIAANEVTP